MAVYPYANGYCQASDVRNLIPTTPEWTSLFSIAAPTAAPLMQAVAGTTGLVAGTYSFVYTYTTLAGETIASQAGSVVITAGQAIQLNQPQPPPPQGVAAIKFYLTAVPAGGPAIGYVAQVPATLATASYPLVTTGGNGVGPPGTGTASSGDTTINTFIQQMAYEIDRVLAPAYVVPVAGDQDALNLLLLINARMTAAELYKIYREASGGSADMTRGEAFRQWAELVLLDIVNGVIRFMSAPIGLENPQFPRGAGASFNPDNDMALDPVLQWSEAGPIFSRITRDTPRKDMLM